MDRVNVENYLVSGLLIFWMIVDVFCADSLLLCQVLSSSSASPLDPVTGGTHFYVCC